MGLLDKTLKLAKEASKAAIDAAGKKSNKQKKKRADEIENIPYKYKYVVTQDVDCGIIIDRDSYGILDINNNVILLAKGTVLRGTHHFIITKNKEEVATVHKHYFNFSGLIEREKKICTIELAGESPFEMRTYVEFKERQYDISKSGWHLSSSSNRIRETEFHFNKGRTKKPAITVYKPGAISNKLIVAFDNEEYSVLAACFAIGIDLIRFSD